MEQVDLNNSQQNAFVQDWLMSWSKHFLMEETSDYDHFEAVIEDIQGLYNYQDHEARKDAVATSGDMDATLRVLGKLIEICRGTPNNVLKDLETTYAFVNACKQLAMKDHP